LVGSRKRILSRTKLTPGSQTTGVSPRRLDNADDVIHGLPDICPGYLGDELHLSISWVPLDKSEGVVKRHFFAAMGRVGSI
jgi:hypothetical protein